MQLYNRYIIRKLGITLLLIALSLTSLIWLTQSLRFIDAVITRGLNVGYFLYLTILLIPSLLVIILPISIFLSTILVFHRLSTESELIALRSVGLSTWQIIKPAFIIAIISTAICYFIMLYLLPVSYRAFKDFQGYIRNQYISVLLQEGVFNTPVNGLTLYIREHNKNTMRGILLHDQRSEHPITMMAEEGHITSSDTGLRFTLSKGNRQAVDLKTGQLSILYFDNYTIDLSFFTEIGKERKFEPQERYLNELLFSNETESEIINKLNAEIHHRITWPLYNIILTLLGLAIYVVSEHNRITKKKRTYIISIAATMLALSAIGYHSSGGKHYIFVILMYINVIIGLMVSLYYLKYKKQLIKDSVE